MTSRLCVKGLPKYVSEARLREHFSAKGEVTDAKVVRSKDGASRQFGFVGFRSAEEAADALKYFNRTFMDTSRIAVEIAEKVGSQQIARPWSRYSEGSSAHKKLDMKQNPVSQDTAKVSKKAAKPAREEEEDDPQLAEFLQLMQPRRAGTIWSNDDVTLAQAAAKGSTSTTSKQPPTDKLKGVARAIAAENSGDEEEDYQELPSSRDSDAQQASDTDADESDLEDATHDAKNAAVLDEGVSDLDYLKSRMKAGVGQLDPEERSSSQTSSLTETGQGEHGEEAEDEVANGLDAEEDRDVVQQDRRASHAQASTREGGEPMPDVTDDADDAGEQEPTGRLFLRNLPFTSTEAELSDAFTDFGDLQEVHLVLDRQTKKSRGIGYVQFTQAGDAAAAMAAMDGSIFQGRLLHVLPARKAPTPLEVPSQKDNVSSGTKFKESKEAERRSQAGNRAAWNTLFMRSDTVAEAVAAHYGITKSQLLSREAADLPVRMALGEAHVIAMTKKALGDAGVSVDVLEEAAAASGRASATHAVQRSPVCLLIKNLPYSASEEDLTELFGGSGPIARLVLPPTKTLALVEFTEPQDARRAFKSLAYKRYQHVPIYLEWAPANIFMADAPKLTRNLNLPLQSSAPAPAAAPDTAPAAASTAASAAETAAATAASVLPEAEDSESSTIYVKNLAFATGDAGLRKHFENTVSSVSGSVRSVKVAMRKGPDGKPLSMGFGFVECSSESVAKAVLKNLQGSMLDKHKLALQLSMRKPTSAVKANKKQPGTPEKQSTKLVVRNMAFEATRKDVMSLFSPFGHMKSCRLPRKFDGTPRGFAFIEFVTKQEAKNAMESIAGAHLYGRRLVVEWAEQGDEGLDEIRAKTAAKFRGETVDEFDEMPTKRRRTMV